MENPNEPKKSKFSEQPHYFQWGLTAFCVIGCCVLVAFVLIKLPFIWNVVKKLFGALSPFIYGFVMLYRRIEPPMSRKFAHGTRVAKGISSLLTLIIGLAVVAGLLWMVLPQLVVSIFSIVESADTYMNDVSNWVTGLLKDNPVIARNFMQVYEQFSEQLVNWVQNIALPHLVTMMTGVVTTVSVVVDILIGIIIALYILNGKETFCAQAKKMTYSLFSIDRANSIIERVAYIHRVFGGFITGKLIDSLIIGVLCFIGMRVMMSVGLLTIESSFALLISVIIGVTNIIPFFGPFIGAIPSAILIMVTSPLQALYFVIFIIILQQIDGNILGPKILGNSTGLSSFWVMFAILIFGGLFGFVGMAIGVPLFAVIYSIVSECINHLLHNRGLSEDTNDYRGDKRLDAGTRQFVHVSSNVPPVSARERRAAAKAKEQSKTENDEKV